jgi:serine/threonine protein kinase
VKEIFSKGDTFLIQEKQMHRLSNYLQNKKQLPPAEVESVIQQVFEGLCEIYEEGYVHRGVRLEHLV